jgi:hypothetical protein
MAQLPIVSYKEILPEVFQDIDKNKIVIKLEDLKAIPELSKYISMIQVIKEGETKLVDYDFETQNEIIKIFLINYNFLQFINGDYFFNYTKLKKYFPNNVYLEQIFNSIKPDLVINTDSEEIRFYKWSNLSDNIKNYVGVLFFTAFYKIENFKEYAKIEYNYFTDIEFSFNDFSLITDMKKFFITEFINFLYTNNGQYFGAYDFGSNLKRLVQTKAFQETYEKIYFDIKGFINDLNILYGDFIELLDFKIDTSVDYELKIFVYVKINEERLGFNVVVTY